MVVEVVESSGGWINKFQGDAALAIFGAPLPVDDAATCALRAARTLDERLRDEVPELEAGIGVAFGEAVAGNIGAESRFEYTVIGDPVNEAARLTDLAKDHTPARARVGRRGRARDRRRGGRALGDRRRGDAARPLRADAPG